MDPATKTVTFDIRFGNLCNLKCVMCSQQIVKRGMMITIRFGDIKTFGIVEKK